MLDSIAMARASAAEREYFARLERAHRALEQERPPASLAEMFDRLEQLRRILGAWARPGMGEGADEGDLPAHRELLARIRAVERRGAKGP